MGHQLERLLCGGKPMLRNEQKQRVSVMLTNARNELEDALNLSALTARYDPVVLRDASRKELSVMVDDLNRLVREIQGSQG
jgi:hypothetical protein